MGAPPPMTRMSEGIFSPWRLACSATRLSSAGEAKRVRDLAIWMDGQSSATEPAKFWFYFYDGTGHGTLHVDAFYTAPGLLQFVEGQLGTGDWASVRP